MPQNTNPENDSNIYRCPDCQAVLKRRRSRTPDTCEMVCGGCGQFFDVCDGDTRESLENPSG